MGYMTIGLFVGAEKDLLNGILVVRSTMLTLGSKMRTKRVIQSLLIELL